MTIRMLKTWNKCLYCDDQYYSPALDSLLQNIDAKIASPIKVFKDDKSSTVVLIECDEQYFVIKRANSKNKLVKLRRLFTWSRARKNWNNTQILSHANIKTFSNVAMYEKRWGPLVLGSYFICTYVEAESALHYFSNKNYAHLWRTISKNILLMIHALASQGISHRDLNLSNILIKDKKPILIDLEAMKKHRFKFMAKLFANHELKRLLKNWHETSSADPDSLKLFKQLLRIN